MQTFSENTTFDLYQQQGFTKLPKLFPDALCKAFTNHFYEIISAQAKYYDITNAELLSIINRWQTGIFNKDLINSFEFILRKYLEKLFGIEIDKVESDLIYKSAYSPKATPCHQDIAYANHHPYEFTTWIPLQITNFDDGALQFLHRNLSNKVEPAIDFWQPNFQDKFRSSSLWQDNSQTITTKAGQPLLFRSDIWHGSTENISGKARLSLVFRWKTARYRKPEIPKIAKVQFGMYNCASITFTKLSDYLSKNNIMPSSEYPELLIQCIEYFNEEKLMKNSNLIVEALEKIYILNDAAKRFSAGDSQGIIYSNLWNVFLKFL